MRKPVAFLLTSSPAGKRKRTEMSNLTITIWNTYAGNEMELRNSAYGVKMPNLGNRGCSWKKYLVDLTHPQARQTLEEICPEGGMRRTASHSLMKPPLNLSRKAQTSRKTPRRSRWKSLKKRIH